MKTIQRIVEVKTGKKWDVSRIVTDELEVYQSLSADIIAKKIKSATWVKSIKRVNNYDGTQNITVTYDNDCRSIYTVKN